MADLKSNKAQEHLEKKKNRPVKYGGKKVQSVKPQNDGKK